MTVGGLAEGFADRTAGRLARQSDGADSILHGAHDALTKVEPIESEGLSKFEGPSRRLRSAANPQKRRGAMKRSLVAAVITAATLVLTPQAIAMPYAPPIGKNVWTYPGRLSLRAARGKNVADKPPPPPPVTYTAPAPEPVTYAAPPPVTSSGGCPSYMSGEATSPTAVNPESGASGCYQVIPSTADAMGAACDDVNSTSCLDAICAAQGNQAWSASGATPCG